MKIAATFAILFTLLLCAPKADAQQFYDSSVENREVTSDLKTDHGVAGDGSGDISSQLQKAIDRISEGGGGILSMPAGTYHFANVELRSNVHIEIDKDAVLTPFVGNKV